MVPSHSIAPGDLGQGALRATLLNLGYAEHQVRARTLPKPFHGVRSASEPRTLLELARAFAPLMGPEDAFSHITALRLYGLPTRTEWTVDEPLHVIGRGAEWVHRGRGIIGHQTRFDTIPIRIVEGMQVIDPVRVMLQAASVLPLDEVVAIGDAMVTPPRDDGVAALRAPLVAHGDLLAAADVVAGARGVKRFREAASLVRVGARSRPESIMRVTAVRAGFPEPVIERPVFDRLGREIGRPDLTFELRRASGTTLLGNEYEGDGHRVDRDRFRYDIRRRERMEIEGGVPILRTTAADLFPSRAPYLASLRARAAAH